MHPSSSYSRSVMAIVRLGLAVVLCMVVIGAALVAPVAGAGPSGQVRQDESDRPDRPDGAGGDGADQTPEQPDTTGQPESPAVVSTPDPRGPARLRLYAPAFEQTVPDGAAATFVLEVAHLGAGGPDAKELWVDAPAGWGIRFAPAAAGETLFDADLDGWPETRLLGVNDWTYVTVTVTTPGTLAATGWATVRVWATSLVADRDAFRSWIDLTVTATVPEPTPAPVVIEPPAEVPPIVVPGPDEEIPSPEPTVIDLIPDPTPEPSPEPSMVDEVPEPLPSPEAMDPSDEATPSDAAPSDGVASGSDPDISAPGSLSPVVSPGESASPDDSGSASTSPSGSTSASASPLASASASPAELTVVSILGAIPGQLDPAETAEVRHGFAVDGLPDDQTVSLVVRAETDEGWPVSFGTEKPVGEAEPGEQVIEVTGDEVVSLVVRVTAPDDAVGGDAAILDISATLAVDGPDVSISEAGTADAADSTYTLVVASTASLRVEGGATFGQVNVFGALDPTVIGVTAVVDDTGATYTRSRAISLTVSGSLGAWQISCQAIAVQLAGGGSAIPFQWRELGGTWQPFPADDSVCISGEGATVVELDVRLRVEWGAPLGVQELELMFTLTALGTQPESPSGS